MKQNAHLVRISHERFLEFDASRRCRGAIAGRELRIAYPACAIETQTPNADFLQSATSDAQCNSSSTEPMREYAIAAVQNTASPENFRDWRIER
jgi:hypothetical protein